ncbi:MAG: hypothetical protein WAX14_13035 [Rhodococcus sp. (in: high G+C Gram-positive bacteria)]|uniref:hypothetical protein n=1 Tax=Rhodococcus sp. TaxID=1831 RepID=UPI003BB5A476
MPPTRFADPCRLRSVRAGAEQLVDDARDETGVRLRTRILDRLSNVTERLCNTRH